MINTEKENDEKNYIIYFNYLKIGNDSRKRRGHSQLS